MSAGQLIRRGPRALGFKRKHQVARSFTKITCGLPLVLLSIAGCSTEDVHKPADDLASVRQLEIPDCDGQIYQVGPLHCVYYSVARMTGAVFGGDGFCTVQCDCIQLSRAREEGSICVRDPQPEGFPEPYCTVTTPEQFLDVEMGFFATAQDCRDTADEVNACGVECWEALTEQDLAETSDTLCCEAAPEF